MQFAKKIAIVSAIAAAGVAADQVVVKNSNIDINVLSTTSVSYANNSLYVGKIHYQSYSEPYRVPSTGGSYFTSYHQAPTGGQSLYIYANETKPVGFTIPHSGYIPQGASVATLDFTGPDGVLAYNGKNQFQGCQVTAADEAADTYQVYWVGDGLPADWKCLPTLDMAKVAQC